MASKRSCDKKVLENINTKHMKTQKPTAQLIRDASPCLVDLNTPSRGTTSYSLRSASSRQDPATSANIPVTSSHVKGHKGSRQLRRIRTRVNDGSSSPGNDSGDDTTTGSVSGSDSDSAMGPDISQTTEDSSSMSLSVSNDHHQFIVEGSHLNVTFHTASQANITSRPPISSQAPRPLTRTSSRAAQEHEDSRENTRSPSPQLSSIKYHPTPPRGSPPQAAARRTLPPLEHSPLEHPKTMGSERGLEPMDDEDAKVRSDMMSYMDYFCTKNKSLVNQIQEAASKNHHLKMQLEALTEENIMLHKKVDEFETINNRFRGFNETLQAQLMAAREERDNFENQVKNDWKDKKILEEELIKLQEVHRKEKERTAETEETLKKTKEELHDMSTALQNYASREQTSKISISKALEEERVKGRERELDALGKITRLEAQMFNYTTRNEELSAEIEKLSSVQNDYQTLKTKLTNEEKRHLVLAVKFREVQDENKRLRQMRRGSLGADSDTSNNSGDGIGSRKNVLSTTTSALPSQPHLGRIDLDLQKPNTLTVPQTKRRGVSPKRSLPALKK